MLRLFQGRLRALTYHSVILKLITAVAAASLLETVFSPHGFNTAEYFVEFALIRYIAVAAAVFAMLLLTVKESCDGYVLLPLLTALFMRTNYADQGVFYALTTALVIGGFVFFLAGRMKLPPLDKGTAILLCAILAAALALFIGGLTILKFLGHQTPTYDFGIFSQMYHYMSETLIPYTTCERDVLLSHFAVHFSPILYAALPFYLIFPHPTTLLAVQAIAVAAAVVPLYKLAKHFGLSNGKTITVILIYVLHPTVIANNFYYFHENCFLTVLLLWTFYFAETAKPIPMYVFACLTLLVKEDAPVYVLFFGLYLLFANKSKRHGSALCLLACVYFAVVTKLMSVYGQGIMAYRYDNFLFEDGGSIYAVILNIFKNPAYLFTQILSAEKLVFLILMLVPMAMLPLAIRKPSSLVLLCPMLLINLMSEYTYQFDIEYQYTYASVAFLFYLTVINLAALRAVHAKKLLLSAACASLIFFSAVNLPRLETYVNEYEKNRASSAVITDVLETIPTDASVRADTLLVPAMWDREELYHIKYSDEMTDYVILDLRSAKSAHVKFKSQNPQYEMVLHEENVIAVFQKKSAD